MNSGSVFAIGSWHAGCSSNGSGDDRHAKAASVSAVNVAPNCPVPYRMLSMLCFGMPNGVVESEPSNAGRSSGYCEWCPVGISE